ncbi:MAG: polyprenyl synthetase family protein [Bacteroidota bacterium]
MTDLKSLQKLVDDSVKKSGFDAQPENLYQPISYSLETGGKRLRPVLMLMAYELYRSDVSQAVKPATGIEIFHNFTLLHDDIMDNAEMRRGKPTVHIKWNPDVAILSGDAMSIIATDLINCAPRNQQAVTKAFTRAALDVCEGQQYDMDFETKPVISEQEYLKMIKLKTASLIAVSLKIGGLMAGAPEHDIITLHKLGIAMGTAFQLQDDWLDCYGNQNNFGKTIGKDIINQKKTYLWVLTNQLASEEQKSLMKSVNENQKISDEVKINTILDIYNQLDISRIALNKINTLFQKATLAIDQLNREQVKKSELKNFLEKLNNRGV